MIDWFTVGAQVLNFLVLVWLMRRYLYRPILDAVDAREKRIAAQIAQAETTQREAEQARDTFARKNEVFDAERAAKLKAATAAAEAERQRLIEQARGAADVLSEKRKASFLSELEMLKRTLGGRAQREVFAIARKALVDLADVSLEARMVARFTNALRGLDADARAELAAAARGGNVQVELRSAFELPAPLRAEVQQAVNEVLSADVPLDFETVPALVSGVELVAGGQRVAWTIADYLQALERGVREVLDGASAGRTPVEPAAAREPPRPEEVVEA